MTKSTSYASAEIVRKGSVDNKDISTHNMMYQLAWPKDFAIGLR